jgi:hypothetical protein
MNEQTDSSAAGVVGAMFGVALLLVAFGSIAAGISIVRSQRAVAVDAHGHATIGWLVLASGVALIVLVTPANISGDLVFRMVALTAWSALFIGFGRLLARTAGPVRALNYKEIAV